MLEGDNEAIGKDEVSIASVVFESVSPETSEELCPLPEPELTPHVLHGDAGVAVDDVGLSDHLVEPVLDRGVVGPPVLRFTMSGQQDRHHVRHARPNSFRHQATNIIRRTLTFERLRLVT